MNTDFGNAHELCTSIICLMQAADALQLDAAACQFRGVWHQEGRRGLSIYLRSDIHQDAFVWRAEVWRKRRVFLALCPREFEGITVLEHRPGDWEAEVVQLGHLAMLPTRRPWRPGALH